MAGEKQAAEKAATPALVTITVAQRRTVHLPGVDAQGEAATVAYGPGATVEVDAAEASRLRDIGFAEPEAAAESDAAAVIKAGG